MKKLNKGRMCSVCNKTLVFIVLLLTSTHVISQWEYDEKASGRFIYSVREYRLLEGIDETFNKDIKFTKVDSTWSIYLQDSVQVSDEIELAALYGIEAKKMNQVVSEAYANEMFQRLIENSQKFKNYCLSPNVSKSVIYCIVRRTEIESYYVFTILTSVDF